MFAEAVPGAAKLEADDHWDLAPFSPLPFCPAGEGQWANVWAVLSAQSLAHMGWAALVWLFPAAAAASQSLCSKKPQGAKPCKQRAGNGTNQPYRCKKPTHATTKCFSLAKYPLAVMSAGCILICWWRIPWTRAPVGLTRSIVSENCFGEGQVCQFEFNRKISKRHLSYDCAGLLRMHECSFQPSHLI